MSCNACRGSLSLPLLPLQFPPFLPVASHNFKICFSTEINLKKMLMFKVDILNFVNVILTIWMNICISFSLHPAMIEINYARFPQASGATERAFMY